MRPVLLLPLLLAAACVPSAVEPPSADAGADEADSGVRDGGFAERDAGPSSDDAGPDADAGDIGPRDGGPRDAGRDAGPRDAGPTLCPADPSAECQRADDCHPDTSGPSNCNDCVDYNTALCVGGGTCLEPPVLGNGDVYTLVLTIDANVGAVQSFAAHVIAGETAGGLAITCADVYADTIDISDRCYNALDSRVYTIPQTGDTYTVSFTSFASGQRSLFIVYGYDRLAASGVRLGVSCTESVIPGPRGNGPYYIDGDNMVRL